MFGPPACMHSCSCTSRPTPDRAACFHQAPVEARHRFAIQAGQGFGSEVKVKPKKEAKKRKPTDPAQKKVQQTDKKAVDAAVREVTSGAARPVDPREAAKGRLDQVQVADWGSGDPDDLGNLRVASVASASTSAEEPLYQQLARRLQVLERNGELAVARPKGAAPLPPFERWSFRKRRYLQYLADHFAVHHMMEAAVMAAVGFRDPAEDAQDQATPAGLSSAFSGSFDPSAAAFNDASVPEEDMGEAEATEQVLDDTPAARALALFMWEAGLDRSECIARDLDNIARASAEAPPTELEPTQQAAAHAEHLRKLAEAARDEEAADGRRETARLRLLAHVYALRVTHLTTGMRIGSAALEKLNLVPIQATRFYDDYPEGVGDPLALFIEALNEAGTFLGVQEREELFEELPSAFQKTSLLLSSLAHED